MKPLGRKAYGSISHLPSSRLGPGDHRCTDGQAAICTTKARPGDIIVVTEKLDGSCCAVANVDGEIVALVRAGHKAQTSPYEQHQLFAAWVRDPLRRLRFSSLLEPGDRVVGEWLAQAHGTRYQLPHDPFVIFDLLSLNDRAAKFPEGRRLPWATLVARIGGRWPLPALLSYGPAISTRDALAKLDPRHHGAIDPIEGVVYRVEADGAFEFMAKHVRADKRDGAYLPEETGAAPIWNWRP